MTAPFASTEASAVIPAELSFLTIYNPSLGDRDENLRDQIVFYTSKESRTRRKRRDYGDEDALEHEEENERLRQVGLAQGMVSFARYVHCSRRGLLFPRNTMPFAYSRLGTSQMGSR